jgi:hypothetical protein
MWVNTFCLRYGPRVGFYEDVNEFSGFIERGEILNYYGYY